MRLLIALAFAGALFAQESSYHAFRVTPTPAGGSGPVVGYIDFVSLDNVHVVALSSPDTVASSIQFRLPGTAGSPGDCLNTDGGSPVALWSFNPCGLAPPVNLTLNSGSTVFTATNTGSGAAASFLANTTSGSGLSAVEVSNGGTGTAFLAVNTSTGYAGRFTGPVQFDTSFNNPSSFSSSIDVASLTNLGTGAALHLFGGTNTGPPITFPLRLENPAPSSGTGITLFTAGTLLANWTAGPTIAFDVIDSSGNHRFDVSQGGNLTGPHVQDLGASDTPSFLTVGAANALITSDIDFTAATAPGLSPSGHARIYMDSGTNTLLASVNGGAYLPLGSSVCGSSTQIQFNNSGSCGASSNLTWNGSVLSTLELVTTSGGIINVGGINNTGGIVNDTFYRNGSSYSNATDALASYNAGTGAAAHLYGDFSGSGATLVYPLRVDSVAAAASGITILHAGTMASNWSASASVAMDVTDGSSNHIFDVFAAGYVTSAAGFAATLTGSPNGQLIMIPPTPTTQYGSMWRNDGGTTYLLMTAVGTSLAPIVPTVGFNSLRPFYANDSTGRLGGQDGFDLTGGMTVDSLASSSSLYLSTTVAGIDANVYLDSPAGHASQLVYTRAGLANTRWNWEMNTTAESGTAVGSDFGLARYNNSGALIDTPIFVTRSTGNVQITDTLTLGGFASGQIPFPDSGVTNTGLNHSVNLTWNNSTNVLAATNISIATMIANTATSSDAADITNTTGIALKLTNNSSSNPTLRVIQSSSTNAIFATNSGTGATGNFQNSSTGPAVYAQGSTIAIESNGPLQLDSSLFNSSGYSSNSVRPLTIYNAGTVETAYIAGDFAGAGTALRYPLIIDSVTAGASGISILHGGTMAGQWSASAGVALDVADFTGSHILDIFGGGGMTINQNSTTTGITENDTGGQCTIGTVHVGGIGCTSDARLKENVVDLSPALSTVLQLRPVTFDYISNQVNSVGFLAQEVQPLMPLLVSQNDDGNYDLAYIGFVPYLVKAIQELQAEIVALQAKLP
jgi:hypothetical protein